MGNLFEFWHSVQERLGTFVGWFDGLAFIQSVLNWKNFFGNVKIFHKCQN